MAILDAERQSSIDSLREEANEYWDKNRKKYFSIIIEAWNLYPEPKINWNESYSMAREMFEAYLIEKNINEAKKWLDFMIAHENNLHLNEYEIDHNIGKFFYEKGDLEKAYESWDKIVRIKMVGYRYFEDEDPKYIKFYKEQRKIKK